MPHNLKFRTLYNIAMVAVICVSVGWRFATADKKVRVDGVNITDNVDGSERIRLVRKSPFQRLVQRGDRKLVATKVPVSWDIAKYLTKSMPIVDSDGKLHSNGLAVKLLDISESELAGINDALQNILEELKEAERARAYVETDETGNTHIVIPAEEAFDRLKRERIDNGMVKILGNDRGSRLGDLLEHDRFYRAENYDRRLYVFKQDLSEGYYGVRMAVERLDAHGQAIGDPRFVEWSKMSHRRGLYGYLEGRYEHLIPTAGWEDYLEEVWKTNVEQTMEGAEVHSPDQQLPISSSN